MRQNRLTWIAKEYEHRERSIDWFWAVGVVAIALAVISIIFHNLLFAVFIIIATVTLLLYALRHPRDMRHELNERGIMIDSTLFPYKTLDSFWIVDHTLPNKLLVKSQKIFMPYLVLHIENIRSEEVRDFLLQYIEEEELHESVAQKLMESLGF